MNTQALEDLNAEGLRLLTEARDTLVAERRFPVTPANRAQRARLLMARSAIASQLIAAVSWVQEQLSAPAPGLLPAEVVMAETGVDAFSVLADEVFDTLPEWREMARKTLSYCGRVAEMEALMRYRAAGPVSEHALRYA
jgi:hypothetical protein